MRWVSIPEAEGVEAGLCVEAINVNGDQIDIIPRDDISTRLVVLIVQIMAAVLQGAGFAGDGLLRAVERVVVVAGVDVADATLSATIAPNSIGISVGIGEGVIAIGGSTPSKVEMKMIVAVVTIADKRMASFIGVAGIVERPICIQVGLQIIAPLGIVGSPFTGVMGFWRILEISIECFRYVLGVGAGTIGCIHHIHRGGAVKDQFSDLVVIA